MKRKVAVRTWVRMGRASLSRKGTQKLAHKTFHQRRNRSGFFPAARVSAKRVARKRALRRQRDARGRFC